MALTYLSLINEVLSELNEVNLTASTFSNAQGIHQHVKNAVNRAIQTIHHEEIEWPFNAVDGSQVLIADDDTAPENQVYSFSATINTVDRESFTLERDDGLAIMARTLPVISYDNWLFRWKPLDDNRDLTSTAVIIPERVFIMPTGTEWGVSPLPDRAYTIRWKQYDIVTDLVNDTDTTNIPDRFRYVIFTGALAAGFRFKEDMEKAEGAAQDFIDGIARMRTVLMNKYDRVEDTRSDHRFGQPLAWAR